MPEGFSTELIQDYAIYSVSISAILGAAITIYKKGIKPMVEHLQQWYDMIEKIDKIFVELTPNGGTSIKDKVDNMSNNLSMLQQIQDAMAADTKSALFRTDLDGKCVWVNRTYTRTTGRNFSELVGHGWQNAIAQTDRRHVVDEWYKSVNEKREFSMELNFETPTGHKTRAKVRSYKLVDSKGELLGYFGNCEILD